MTLKIGPYRIQFIKVENRRDFLSYENWKLDREDVVEHTANLEKAAHGFLTVWDEGVSGSEGLRPAIDKLRDALHIT